MKKTTIAAGALALLLNTAPVDARGIWVAGTKWFGGYSPNISNIVEGTFSNLKRDSEEKSTIKDIIKTDFREYIDETPKFYYFKDAELSLMALILDPLNLHKEGKGYFMNPENYSVPPVIINNLINTAKLTGSKKPYEDLASILLYHDEKLNSLVDLTKQDMDQRIEDIENSSKNLLKVGGYTISDELLVTNALAKEAGLQESYSAFTKPASDLMRKFEEEMFLPTENVGGNANAIVQTYKALAVQAKTYPEKLKSRYFNPSTISSSIGRALGFIDDQVKDNAIILGLEDEEKIKTKKSELRTDYLNRFLKLILIFKEEMPPEESPESYIALGEKFFRSYVLHKITPEETRGYIRSGKALLTAAESEITFEKLGYKALEFAESERASSGINDLYLGSKLLFNNITKGFMEAIMSVPFIQKNIAALKLNDEIYKPLKQANAWAKTLEAVCQNNHIAYTPEIRAYSIRAFKEFIPLIPKETLKDYDPKKPKRGQLAVIERIKGLTSEGFLNSIDYVVQTNKSRYPEDKRFRFVKLYGNLTKPEEKLAYTTKNAGRILKEASKEGYSYNSLENLLRTMANRSMPSEKVYNAMLQVIDEVSPRQTSSFIRIYNEFKSIAKVQRMKMPLDPNEFAAPSRTALSWMNQNKLSLGEVTQRMRNEYIIWKAEKKDRIKRPFLYKNMVPLGFLNSEKLALNIQKERKENFYLKSNAPVVKMVRKIVPFEVHQILQDKPNIIEQNYRRLKALVPNLPEETLAYYLSAVNDIKLSKPEINPDILSKSNNGIEEYTQALRDIGIYIEKVFDATAEFAIAEHKDPKEAVKTLAYLNELCKEEKEESRLLYVRHHIELTAAAKEVGLSQKDLRYNVARLVRIPELPGNRGKYTPIEVYNFRTITKSSHTMKKVFELIEEDKRLTINDLEDIMIIGEHVSRLCAPKKDPLEFLYGATEYISASKKFFKTDALLTDKQMEEAIDNIYKAMDPPHNYANPEKLIRIDSIARYENIAKERAGFFPR